jgi:serine/threonine protein kinase
LNVPNSPESSLANNGDVLDGKYRVERTLGVGGMGVVVAARHMELGTRVAIKFMRKERASDKVLVERFLREARAASRLRSGHTVRVFDVGRLENGSPYMVMELLSGETLATRLERQRLLPLGEAVDYVLQASEGIAEAHAQGLIHRDLKPQNLFLTKRIDGKPLVKVLDFGVAKLLSNDEDAMSLTTTSVMIGSPVYMSPEQMRAASNVDGRSDIWSLGVCLYELLTGQAPFRAATHPALCSKVLYEPARPPSELRPEIPHLLDRAVLRCLEKDPANRFRDVGDFARALDSSTDNTAVDRVIAVLRTKSEAPIAPESQIARHDPFTDTRVDSHAETRAVGIVSVRLDGRLEEPMSGPRGEPASGGGAPSSLPPSMPAQSAKGSALRQTALMATAGVTLVLASVGLTYAVMVHRGTARDEASNGPPWLGPVTQESATAAPPRASSSDVEPAPSAPGVLSAAAAAPTVAIPAGVPDAGPPSPKPRHLHPKE